VAVYSVVVVAPQPEPASCLKSATHDVSFLRSDLVLTISEYPVKYYSEVLWHRAKEQGFVVEVDLNQLTFSFPCC